MLGNDSSTGGFLSPLTSPIMGQELNRLLQQLIVGITGLPGQLVRPRWQTEPANVPDSGTAWAAVGIQRRETSGFAWEGFSRGENPVYSLSRHEEFRLLCSFYDNGLCQQADGLAASLRDGLQLAQNRETLAPAGLGYINSGDLTPLPSLLKTRWLYRVDLPLNFRRTLTWTYPVLPLAGTRTVIDAERPDGTLYTQTILLPEG